MIAIRPFKGIRPLSHIEGRITDSRTASNPPLLPTINPAIDPKRSLSARFEAVRDRFLSLLTKGYLKRESEPCFYIYRQKTAAHSFTGIIAGVAADDYFDGRIRVHERTLPAGEAYFTDYLDVVKFHSEPVLLMFPDNNRIRQIIDIETRNTPFHKQQMESDGISHTFWVVNNRRNIEQIVDIFKRVAHLYIADGHHRMASAATYAKRMRARDATFVGTENYNYISSCLIPESELKIYEYNRLVRDLNGRAVESFLTELARFCTIHPKGDKPYYPSHKHCISMYLEGRFYGLFIKREFRGKPKGLGELDTYIFEENVLKPILSIQNAHADKRIKFLPGTGDINGVMDMKEWVDTNRFRVGFGFYPISVADLKYIADLHLVMPPKSTYIQPKLRNGMVIYKLDEE
ncbi:MAG: DUF1015 domain-containing protein [Flavobacteriales bacterium]